MTTNIENPSAWDGDWRERLSQGLRLLGHTSLLGYLKSNEVATFEELIKSLGGQLAPIQLLRVLREEANTQAAFDYYVRSTFVRRLREMCPLGWRRHRDFDLVLAFTDWVAGLGDPYSSMAHTVLQRLRSRGELSDDW